MLDNVVQLLIVLKEENSNSNTGGDVRPLPKLLVVVALIINIYMSYTTVCHTLSPSGLSVLLDWTPTSQRMCWTDLSKFLHWQTYEQMNDLAFGLRSLKGRCYSDQ